MKKYLHLCDGVKLVKGYTRAALYDTQTGDVYSINRDALLLIEEAASGLLGECDNFIKSLLEYGLFSWIDKPYNIFELYTNEISFPKPDTKLNFLWAEITNRCNLQCLHCYANSSYLEDCDELSTNNWMNIIKNGYDCGAEQIQFIGGEPLLRKDLQQLIQFASDIGFSKVEIFTNGTLLNQTILNWAKNIRGICFAISLYSNDKETHDLVTQIPGSWLMTTQAIQLISDNGIPLRIALVIMQQNEHSVEQTLNYCKENGLYCQKPDIIRPSGRGSYNLIPTRIDLVKSCTRTEPEFYTSSSGFERARNCNTCWAGKVVITPNGDVLPCVFARDIVLGNINGQLLSDILSTEQVKYLWSLTKDKILECKYCEYRYACKDCRPLAIEQNKQLLAKSPRCTYNPVKGVWMSLQDKS